MTHLFQLHNQSESAGCAAHSSSASVCVPPLLALDLPPLPSLRPSRTCEHRIWSCWAVQQRPLTTTTHGCTHQVSLQLPAHPTPASSQCSDVGSPYVCISFFSCPVTRLASTIFHLYVLIWILDGPRDCPTEGSKLEEKRACFLERSLTYWVLPKDPLYLCSHSGINYLITPTLSLYPVLTNPSSFREAGRLQGPCWMCVSVPGMGLLLRLKRQEWLRHNVGFFLICSNA